MRSAIGRRGLAQSRCPILVYTQHRYLSKCVRVQSHVSQVVQSTQNPVEPGRRDASFNSSSNSASQSLAGSDDRSVVSAEPANDWEAELEELLKLVSLLPGSVRTLVEEHPDMPQLLEVVMDLGRYPLARFPAGDVKLGDQVVTAEDLEQAVAQVGDFGGDNRAGIDRTLHRISCIRNRSGKVIGLTCRVGRAIRGSARLVSDLVLSGASILFLGRPGVGKTTAIREVSRALADELQKRVVIVDTSNEIGGDGDIPHEGIGKARRIQVPVPEAQHKVMIEAVENHMPEVVVIDEIGTEQECAAARTIAQRGVQLVATAHGNELENVIKNPSLADLVGGIQSVTLGDEEARKRGVQKSILERAGPPTFDVAVEMLERSKWRVHLDVAHAVDLILAGGSPGGQVRERAVDGSVLRYTTDPALSGALARPAKDLSNNTGTNVTGGGSIKAAKAAAVAALAAQEAAREAAANSTNLPKGLRTPNMMPALQQPAAGVSASLRPISSSSTLYSSTDSQDEDDVINTSSSTASTGATSGFLKRSVQAGIESEAQAAEADLPEDGVATQKGARRLASRQALQGVKPSEVILRLFPYELDADKLWEVLLAMELTHKVLIVRRVAQADAVLGLRAKVKSDAALRQASKAARVPIYAIKATGTANLVRALRTLLGVPGTSTDSEVFVVWDDDVLGRGSVSWNLRETCTETCMQSTGEAATTPEGATTSSVESIIASQDQVYGAVMPSRSSQSISEVVNESVAVDSTLSVSTTTIKTTTTSSTTSSASSPAARILVTSSPSSSTSSYRAGQTTEALEEARLACENLVGPLRQSVELLPRDSTVIQEQIRLVQSYDLQYEVVVAAADTRLKVMPKKA